MTMSTLAKEQENFLRYAILIVDHSREALQDLVELNIKNKHLTFQEFLDKNQHEIYHLCYDFRCCQCQNSPTKRKRIIFPSQLELLFDKYNKLPSHRGTGHNDFCCSYAKVGITSQVLDLSLARCLLVNFCLDVFWFTCLTSQGQILEQFLNLNKHIIYHLWKNNQNCCQCTPGFIFPCNSSLITENDWKSMYSSQLSPCENDRKRMSTGSSSVCSVGATPGIATQDINPEIQRFILQNCSHISKTVDILVEQRNLRFAHVPEAKISDSDFRLFLRDIENHLLGIARVCGKETHVKKNLRDLHLKPLSLNMLGKYEKLLHINMEAINKNINLQHRTTRQSIPKLVDKSSKIRKIEERVDALETSVAKITDEVKDLSKIIKERSKRQRIINQTSAEIESHKKEGTYLETEAVRHCIQLLESRNVVILSGREGSGKSRNSLEILRQLKEKNGDLDVFKLIGLHYVSDIVKCNVTSIVLFDDAFDKTCDPFSYDKHILDHLHYYITRNKVKFIIVMRNTVKHACQKLLSTHKLFHDLVIIDLNSEKFKLTMEEKENMLSRYCDINKIKISDMKDDDSDQSVSSVAESDDNEAIRSVQDQATVILKREIMNEIIETDPFLGFPECCRLFTDNRNSTHLDASCFKWPSSVLVNDIETLRMEGIDKYMIGLKYVILIYILTLGTSGYRTTICVKKDIDAEICKQIYNVCYNMVVEVRKSDIEHVCKVLTGCYLVNKDETYGFQHKAIQDSVIMSYSKINPKAIIPLLRLNHMEDLIRLHNYTEQEDDIVIKISKQTYHDFAKKIISVMKSCYNPDYRCFYRLMKSAIFRENNIDLIYQLFLSINEEKDTLRSGLPSIHIHHIPLFFPLYLLSHMGKLDDKRVIVNHTKYEMLISVLIGDQHITFSIIPNLSLEIALKSNDKHIAEWLLRNTDHSLLDFVAMSHELDSYNILDYLHLLEQLNVNYDLIDMTELFHRVFYKCKYENCETHAVDWLMDNVDNALIDYNECLDDFIFECNSETHIDLTLLLHVIKKVDHNRIDIDRIAKSCCFSGCSVIIEWALQNFDHEVLDRERLIDTAIDLYEEHKNGGHNRLAYKMEKVVEVIILETSEIKRFNIDRLVDVANKGRWYRVLELLIKYIGDIPMNVSKIIENAFQQCDNDEDEDDERYDCDDEEHDTYMTNHGEHMKNILYLIMKHYFDRVDVKKLVMETAFRVGLHEIVEMVLLNKFDYISYLLNTTLDKLRSEQNNDGSVRFDIGCGKKLLPLIKTVNLNLIDLDSLMNDLCYIGHSSAVMWLLENKPSYRFSMIYIMNKACFHDDLPLVLYLFKNFSAEDFEYKTAMIKACRNKEKKTLAVCKWLWENIDRGLFDMKAALNNACKYDRCEVVEWILKDVDTGLYDIQAALICVCENGTGDVFTRSSMVGVSTYLYITKLLYERADKLSLDINVVFSAACKFYKTDIVSWIIENQNITGTETTNGNKNFVKSFDKTFLDMDHAITCILDMDVPEQIQSNVNNSKIEILLSILKQSDPKMINIYKVLTETCKNDWVNIFQLLLERVDHACLNIGEVVNIACRDGAFKIVKWSLENIDLQLLDADNVIVESCGFGWLECLVLIWKHCDQYKLQEAMTEACTYGRRHIAEWLIQNVHYQLFNIPMFLQEAGRNGWIIIFRSLLKKFIFDKSDMHNATSQALENGHLTIAELALSTFGKHDFDFSALSEKAYIGANKEGVVNFLLHNVDPRSIDISTILTNACFFGWKDISTFIVDSDLTSLCDLSLALNTACDNGELEIAQLLLEKVDPHILTSVDKAMHSVAVKGWDEIAVLLLDTVEHTRLDIGNALIEACHHGEIDVVQAILRKVDNNMLDVEAALDKTCENHMHEGLVLWILENIDQEQVDLTTVKIQAVRHKWWKVQFALTKKDIEGLIQAKQETESDNIVILE